MDIPEEILQKTTKCPHDFKCLSPGQCGDSEKCKVECPLGDDILVLSSKGSLQCPYRVPFGDELLCACPTRCLLYRKKAI